MRKKEGVLVQIHDHRIPYDDPTAWIWLLTCSVGDRMGVVLPSVFVSSDGELSSILKLLWQQARGKKAETHGDCGRQNI